MRTELTEDQQPSAEERYGRMRRRDRLVEDEAWIRAYLCGAPFGVMATAREHQPSMIPNTFVYDEQAHAIYIHTGRQSRLRENIEANDRACFCVSKMGRLLPAKEAIEFSVEYTSVVAYGRVSIVTDEAEMERALQALLDKYFPHLRPGPDYHPMIRLWISLRAPVRRMYGLRVVLCDVRLPCGYCKEAWHEHRTSLLGGFGCPQAASTTRA